MCLYVCQVASDRARERGNGVESTIVQINKQLRFSEIERGSFVSRRRRRRGSPSPVMLLLLFIRWTGIFQRLNKCHVSRRRQCHFKQYERLDFAIANANIDRQRQPENSRKGIICWLPQTTTKNDSYIRRRWEDERLRRRWRLWRCQQKRKRKSWQ